MIKFNELSGKTALKKQCRKYVDCRQKMKQQQKSDNREIIIFHTSIFYTAIT